MRAPGRHRANRGGAGPGCVRSVTIKRILSGQGLVCVLSISGACSEGVGISHGCPMVAAALPCCAQMGRGEVLVPFL